MDATSSGYTLIKRYGFDEIIIRKQLDELENDKAKKIYLENVKKIIIELKRDLYLLERYMKIIEKRIIEIKGRRGFSYLVDELIDSLKKHKDGYINENDLENILKQATKEKRNQIREIYFNAKYKLIEKVFERRSYPIIDEILNNLPEDTESYNATYYILKNFRTRIKEINIFRDWVLLELAKFRYIVAFIDGGENSENEKVKDESRNRKRFKRGELKRELSKIIPRYGLIIGKTVESETLLKITNELIKAGWDASKESVGTVFRTLGYVEGRRV